MLATLDVKTFENYILFSKDVWQFLTIVIWPVTKPPHFFPIEDFGCNMYMEFGTFGGLIFILVGQKS